MYITEDKGLPCSYEQQILAIILSSSTYIYMNPYMYYHLISVLEYFFQGKHLNFITFVFVHISSPLVVATYITFCVLT